MHFYQYGKNNPLLMSHLQSPLCRDPAYELLTKSRSDIDDRGKQIENKYKEELFQWIKNTHISEIAINQSNTTHLIIRMFINDQYVDHSNYALKENNIKYPQVQDELKDVICIKKRKTKEEQAQMEREKKLLSHIQITESDDMFDTFCIRGSFEEIFQLLLECSNGLAFSSQPKVQYQNKQFTVSNAIWFNPITYQSCAAWIINEMEKQIAMMFYQYKQGFNIQQPENSLQQFWEREKMILLPKLQNQIPQIKKEILNAQKKSNKTCPSDIQWAQLMMKHSKQNDIDEQELQQKLDNILDMKYIKLTDISSLKGICQRRLMKIISDNYKVRIMKEICDQEQKQQFLQNQKKQQKKKNKSKKSKTKEAASALSQRELEQTVEQKGLNYDDLMEALKNLEEKEKDPSKIEIFTPPNSPSNETDSTCAKSQSISQSQNLTDLTNIMNPDSLFESIHQPDSNQFNSNEEEDDWIKVQPPKKPLQRNFSSQKDLQQRKIKKNRQKQNKSQVNQKNPLNDVSTKSKNKQDSNQYITGCIIESNGSQENDESAGTKTSECIINVQDEQQIESPCLIGHQQQNSLENDSPSVYQQNVEIFEKVDNQVQQKTNESTDSVEFKLEKLSLIQQSQSLPVSLQQLDIKEHQNDPIDPIFMDQAFQAMIKKLDLDMREMNDLILKQNEDILPLRQIIFNRLQFLIHQTFRDCNANIRLFGSCATGLSLPESDIDIGITGFELIPTNQLQGPIQILTHLLQGQKWITSVKAILSSQIPILKLKVDPNIRFIQPTGYQIPFMDLEQPSSQTTFSVDITFIQFKSPNTFQHQGLISTDYIIQLVQYYQELRPLVFLFKSLLKKRGLNDQYKGGISSFNIILMVVAFLEHNYEKFPSLGMATYRFLEFYGTQFDPQRTGIRINYGGNFFELDEYENELELTIISPFSYEIISSASTFVQTILQDLKGLYLATQNEIQFFYEKFKYNKKKKGKKDERNLFMKELNKLMPLFGKNTNNF